MIRNTLQHTNEGGVCGEMTNVECGAGISHLEVAGYLAADATLAALPLPKHAESPTTYRPLFNTAKAQVLQRPAPAPYSCGVLQCTVAVARYRCCCACVLHARLGLYSWYPFASILLSLCMHLVGAWRGAWQCNKIWCGIAETSGTACAGDIRVSRRIGPCIACHGPCIDVHRLSLQHDTRRSLKLIKPFLSCFKACFSSDFVTQRGVG